MTVRRGLAVAATLAVVAGLGGCSSEEPGASPPVSSSPSPSETDSASPSPTDAPSVPSLPAGAASVDAEGAVAFVRHYLDLITYAENTGDVEPLRAASAKACESCEGVIDVIEKNYQDGGSMKTEGWTAATFFAGRPLKRPGSYAVSGRVTIGMQRIRNSDGSTERFKGTQQLASFFVERMEESWLIDKFTFVDK